MAKTRKTRYWRISPGEDGFLWREQKLNECIAIGWSAIGDLTGMSENEVRAKFEKLKWPCDQFLNFFTGIQKGDKVVASASGKGVYALGTVIGDYEYNKELAEYHHSRKVRWETTFWHPVDIDKLNLGQDLNNKFKGRGSKTIRELTEPEWHRLCEKLNEVPTPFRNLGMWGGLIQSPEYENEVIILFSQMLQYLHMRIVSFGTRFPDAIVERKENGKWRKVNIEFELYSSGFEDHLDKWEEKNCHTIVCWEHDWENLPKKPRLEIIELKKELEEIL